jgi:hypothetical protein
MAGCKKGRPRLFAICAWTVAVIRSIVGICGREIMRTMTEALERPHIRGHELWGQRMIP